MRELYKYGDQYRAIISKKGMDLNEYDRLIQHFTLTQSKTISDFNITVYIGLSKGHNSYP